MAEGVAALDPPRPPHEHRALVGAHAQLVLHGVHVPARSGPDRVADADRRPDRHLHLDHDGPLVGAPAQLGLHVLEVGGVGLVLVAGVLAADRLCLPGRRCRCRAPASAAGWGSAAGGVGQRGGGDGGGGEEEDDCGDLVGREERKGMMGKSGSGYGRFRFIFLI